MSNEGLLTTLGKLCKLHKSLYELSVKKTDMIKNGDMEALNQLLKDEQKHIAAIEHLEQERQKFARAIASNIDNPTASDCIELLPQSIQSEFTSLIDELEKTVNELKEQNYLNQQLIHHSLQFVNLSMSLMMPQSENLNYEPPTKKNQPSGQSPQGLFNTKA